MPVYLYRCCDHGLFRVEKPSGFTERHAERCPECNGPTNRFFVRQPLVFNNETRRFEAVEETPASSQLDAS